MLNDELMGRTLGTVYPFIPAPLSQSEGKGEDRKTVWAK
jgi:hypothetical protein